MPNYQNGKIYKIIGTNNEGIDLIYIGSTTQLLSQRLGEHRRDAIRANYSSKQLIECINHQIILIENYSCNSKKELVLRERYYYDLLECVNKYKPIQLKEELKEHKHQYYIDNIEKLKEHKKQYRIDNIDKIKEQRKQHRIDNIEKFKEKDKQYWIENKDKIKKRQQAYFKQYRIDNAEKIKEKSKQDYIKRKLRLAQIA
jgi:hypothetical protein